MQSQRVFWVAIAAAAWFVWGGVSVEKPATIAARPVTAGNAALAACPALPTDAKPIAGLHTAWAIYDQTSGGIRLVFSDHERACRDIDRGAPPFGDGRCVSSWEFAFTLPPDAQKPGTYNLHDYESDYAEKMVFATPRKDGCQSGTDCMGGGTGAAGGAKGPESTVEIFSVSEECVTGHIQRLVTGHIQPEVDFTGTFQAVVCKPASN